MGKQDGIDNADMSGWGLMASINYIEVHIPDAFVVENVVGMTFPDHRLFVNHVLLKLLSVKEQSGSYAYRIDYKIVNTESDTSLVQCRRRFVIVGNRLKTMVRAFQWPAPCPGLELENSIQRNTLNNKLLHVHWRCEPLKLHQNQY
jgi:site-specific DNA-cytosine methylase